MERECCNCRITETDDGYRIDIKAQGLKEKFETTLKNCCCGDMKKGPQSCCASGK